jgi:hypothetical protein
VAKRLWEVDHPYYCMEGNYFAKGWIAQFASWQDFAEEAEGQDMDLNLLFRWDWDAPTEDDAETIKWSADESVRESTLKLFYMGQRKGIYRTVLIRVAREDEPAIREWLKVRFEHLLTLWAPFNEVAK